LSARVRTSDATASDPGVPEPEPSPDDGDDASGTLREMMDRVERRILTRTLAAHANNKTSAAKALGITREGLHKKLKSLGM
jgi:DNA-binding NtrC family response regulator